VKIFFAVELYSVVCTVKSDATDEMVCTYVVYMCIASHDIQTGTAGVDRNQQNMTEYLRISLNITDHHSIITEYHQLSN
jgi:hypothetical protein